jgi:hypothetical protein
MSTIIDERKAIIVDIYNKEQLALGLPTIVASNYLISVPNAYVGDKSVRNTKIFLTPITGKNNLLKFNIFYDRLNLDNFPITVVKLTGTTLYEVLDQLNEQTGYELDTSDVVDMTIPDIGSFRVQAKSSSLLFIGSFLVTRSV